MEMENDFSILEQALIQVIDSDDTIRKQSEEIIKKIEETDDCFGLFMEILFQSAEPRARNQAAIQLCFMVNLRIQKIDDAIKGSLKKVLVDYLVNSQTNTSNDTQIIINNIIECIRILAENDHQMWTELDEYIDQFIDTLDYYRIFTLNNVIRNLESQFIEEKYQVYGQIVSLAIISSDDLSVNTEGIYVLSYLIQVSNSLDGFEQAFEKICQIFEYIPTADILTEDQRKFLKSINRITSNEIFPPQLITPIIDLIMNQNIPESTAILAFEAIEPVIKSFSLEQIQSIIQQIIFFSNKYMENEMDLPTDFMQYLEKCFTYFPHLQIYEYLKKIITDLLSSNMPLAITLFWPIILSAYEQITKDLDNIIDILKAGFVSDNSLTIESCALIMDSMSDISQFVSKCFDPLFPVILPLFESPNPDIRTSAFNAMQSLFVINDKKNDISIIGSLWNCKENINPDDYEPYFLTLGNAISCSEQLDDGQVHEILEFILPMLADSSDSIPLMSDALFIIGQLINNGEFAEIETIIPSTYEAIKKCLSFKNDEVVNYALSYIAELTDSYEENVIDMLNEIWPLIEKKLIKHKCKETVLQLLLAISCDIAKLCGNKGALDQVLIYLNEEFNTDHYETYLKTSPRIIKIIDDNLYYTLFVRVIHILIHTEDIDEAKIGFKALYKFLKHPPEQAKEEVIKNSAQVISMFFEGSLPCLDNMTILNPEVDIDTDLVDNFSEFLGKFVSYESPYVESACENALKMANRDEKEFKNFVIQIFIDAIENGTVAESVSLDLIDNLEPFLSTDEEDFQQNIVYLMIIILKKFPSFIDNLAKYVPIVSEWWNQSMTNKKRYALLISNIASLFLRIESMTSGIPQEILDQLIEFYPPSDLSETDGMSECILLIFSNHQEDSKPISPSFRLNTAIGIAKLLTESAKALKKMNLQSEIKDKLLELFRFLCQDQEIVQAVMESLSKNEKRKSAIMEIIES